MLRTLLKRNLGRINRNCFRPFSSKNKEVKIILAPEDSDNKYEVTAEVGDSLMYVIKLFEMKEVNPDAIGICDGALSCNSCACHIKSKYDKLPKPIPLELDTVSTLDFPTYENSTRMTCQIKLTEEMEGMEVVIPLYLQD